MYAAPAVGRGGRRARERLDAARAPPRARGRARGGGLGRRDRRFGFVDALWLALRRASRSPGRWTRSAACSAARCGTRRSRRTCAAGSPASRCSRGRRARRSAAPRRARSPRLAGVRASVVSGGVLCVAGTAGARPPPAALLAYDARTARRPAAGRRPRTARRPRRGDPDRVRAAHNVRRVRPPAGGAGTVTNDTSDEAAPRRRASNDDPPIHVSEGHPGPAARGRAGHRCPGRREDRGAGPGERRPPRGVVTLAAQRPARGVRGRLPRRRSMVAPSIVLPRWPPGPSSSPAAPPASGGRPPSASPRAGSRCTPPRAASAAIADLEARGCRMLALDVTDEASMRAAVERSSPSTGASARSSTTPATASRARSRRSRSTTCAGSSRRTSSGSCACASSSCPGMRAQRRGRIVNVSLDGRELHVPGRRPLPRDEVRGRGDQRRAALRGRGLRDRRRHRAAGAHPHRLRRRRRRTRSRPRRRRTARTRRSTRRSPGSTQERLRARPARAPRRRAGDRRADDRARDHGASRRRSATASRRRRACSSASAR